MDVGVLNMTEKVESNGSAFVHVVPQGQNIRSRFCDLERRDRKTGA